MQGNKENQEISVVGRLISLEALVFLMGVVSLVYGLVVGAVLNIAIGALILVSSLRLQRGAARADGRRTIRH